MPDASRILLSQQEKICGLDARGLRQAYFIESMEETGSVIWLSVWDSLGDVQEFLSGPYNADTAIRLAPYLQAAPEWYQYRILDPCME
jgi:hypothetical protein